MAFWNKQVHVGININDRSMELAVVDDVTHPKIVSRIGRVTLVPDTITKGVILHEARFSRAIASLRGQAGLGDTQRLHATLSVSEDLIFPFSVSASSLLNTQQRANLVRETAKDLIPIPVEHQSLFILDEQSHHETTFAYALDRRIMQHYERLLASSNIHIVHIEPESIAMTRFALADVHKYQALTIIDIGTTITHVITLTSGHPVLSQTIAFGADMFEKAFRTFMEGKKEIKTPIETLLASVAEPLLADIKHRLEQADDFLVADATNRSENEVMLLGGGSLLPYIADIIEKGTGRRVHTAVIGQPLQHPGIPSEELRVFAQAIGSALRTSSFVAGTRLMPINETDVPKPHISMGQFKSRTQLLLAIFVILLVVFVAAIIFRIGTSGKQSPNTLQANQSANQNIQANDSLSGLVAIDFAVKGANPTAMLLEQTTEKTVTIETTGAREVDGFASGTVTLTNTTNSDKDLVAETRLQAPDGTIVRLQSSVVLPKNGTQDVSVKADASGKAGNLDAGIRLTVPGLNEANQQLIYGTTKEKFTGGIITERIVSDEDIATAKTLARGELEQTVRHELESSVEPGNIVVFIPDEIILSTVSTPAIGAPASQTSVMITAKGSAIQFVETEIRSRIQETIEGNATLVSTTYSIAAYDLEAQKGTLNAVISYKR